MTQPSVFVSHSRHDKQIVDYFTNIFAHIGLHAQFYEWQRKYTGYAGQEITDHICNPDTVAVFVLLGKNLESPPEPSRAYTHNWVSFEVGIASGVGRPIWVFEEFGSLIRYPVPFVTDYAQYTIKSVQHLQEYGTIFKGRFISRTNDILPHITNFRCPYSNCNAIYNRWADSQRFNCPVCRRRIPIPERPQFTPPFPSNVV